MACTPWLTTLVALQLVAPSRPLDPDVPRSVPAPEPVAPPPSVVVAPAVDPVQPNTAKRTRCLPARKRCRRLTVPGIALTAAGGLSLGAGIAFIAIGQPVISDEPASLRDFQTPGIAMTVVGGTALLTGVALLIMGRVAHRREARQK